MRYASQLIPAASGRLGGLVATHGRAGPQLRARTPRTQPRSPSQQQGRAIIGGLAAAWRTLSLTQRTGWSSLAETAARQNALGQVFSPSGYNLFVSCNRTLRTLGPGPLLRDAQPPTLFPSLVPFAAIPQLGLFSGVEQLIGWQLTFPVVNFPPLAIVIRATPSFSQGKAHFRKSDFRIIVPCDTQPIGGYYIQSQWISLFGPIPPYGTATFSITLVDQASGFASASVRATASYGQPPAPPPPGATIGIDINTTPIAEVPLTGISIGGVIIAAP